MLTATFTPEFMEAFHNDNNTEAKKINEKQWNQLLKKECRRTVYISTEDGNLLATIFNYAPKSDRYGTGRLWTVLNIKNVGTTAMCCGGGGYDKFSHGLYSLLWDHGIKFYDNGKWMTGEYSAETTLETIFKSMEEYANVKLKIGTIENGRLYERFTR